MNFPEKVHCKLTNDETKGIIPALDLSLAKNANYKLEKKVEEKGKTPRITKKINKQTNEEWTVSIKYAGLTKDELERLSRNKLLVKLFEAMLNLNRIIEEKNVLLQSAVGKLKQAQQEKIKKERENIELYQKIISIREEVEEMMGKGNTKRKDKVINCMSTLQKNQKDVSGNIWVNEQESPSEKKKSLMMEASSKYEMTESSMINNPHQTNKDELDMNGITIEDLNVNLEDLNKNQPLNSNKNNINNISNVNNNDTYISNKEIGIDVNFINDEQESPKSNVTEIR